MLTPVEQAIFGGVDSRSNPVNMPARRVLRCRNMVPKVDGHLELRDGYATFTMSTVTAGAIHSMQPFTSTSDGSEYLIFWQGTTPKLLKLSDGTVTASTIKDTPIASSSRFSYALTSQGKLVAFNGTDRKIFDGSAWRDCGLPQPDTTLAALKSIGVIPGVPELTSGQAAAVGLAVGGGGTFGSDSMGRFVYCALFDTSTSSNVDVQQIGPATISVGSGRIKPGVGQQINITGLPDLTGTSYVKLLAISDDGGQAAYFCTNKTVNIGNIVSSLTGYQITANGHSFSVGDIVIIAGNSNSAFNLVWRVANIIDANNFEVQRNPYISNSLTGNGGTVSRIVSVATATTNATITGPTVDRSYTANEDRGIPASTVATDNAGFQLYISIYNPVSGAVGNRVTIGGRLKFSVRSNVRISGLNALLTAVNPHGNSEWTFLLGRTGDGGEVPYALIDDGGNWITVNGATSSGSEYITAGNIDGNSELPIRNGLPPLANKVWREGDRLCCAIENSPTVYRSESEVDQQTGAFVGDPAQSWDADNIETFPTAKPIKAGHGYQSDSFVHSKGDTAILIEQAGDLQWQGPMNVGSAGQFAWAIGWRNLPCWITQQKELAVFEDGVGPLIISSEYEAALLANIGDVGKTEIVYMRDTVRQIDILRIKCVDANDAPFTVIHDFNLRDDQSPYGQGYDEVFLGPLATDHTTVHVIDDNGNNRILAGASTGQIYELHNGANDVGSEFTADVIGLKYLGPNRPATKELEWYGDSNVKWYLSRRMDTAFDITQYEDLQQDAEPELVINEDGNSHYVVRLDDTEMTHALVWMQLQSHSEDGDLSLNNPPHLPLETYGRVWMISPLMGASRGR